MVFSFVSFLEQFRRHFRLARPVAEKLVAEFAVSSMCPSSTHGGVQAKSAETHVLTFIWLVTPPHLHPLFFSLYDACTRTHLTMSPLLTVQCDLKLFFFLSGTCNPPAQVRGQQNLHARRGKPFRHVRKHRVQSSSESSAVPDDAGTIGDQVSRRLGEPH